MSLKGNRSLAHLIAAASLVGTLGSARAPILAPSPNLATASSIVSSQDAPGAFDITGDPESPAGATWVFRGTVDGMRYDLAGVLLKPHGAGPFPAVILSHGYEGSAGMFADFVGPTMVAWGLVCIAPNYTHATGVPIGSPGGTSPGDRGASRVNLLRIHMTRTLLGRLGYVDLARVALHGHSMGAYLDAAAAAAYPTEFRVASSTGGGVRPDRIRFGPAPSSSAVRGIRIPFQMHHGDADDVVPLDDDRRFASILDGLHVPNELYVYPGGHLAPRSNPLMFERVHAWYARFGMF
jgi:dienelactone hydrolase